jgi:outer membrane protein assembly factor BamB
MKQKLMPPFGLFPIIFIFLSIFILCVTYGNADVLDWPRWRGPNGNGISMETDWNPEALAGNPKILWKVDLGFGYSNVAIKDNRLYTTGNMGRENIVYCLTADTGEEIWRYSFEEKYQEPQATPTIDGKFVYALSKNGILLCLKAKNGKLRWKKDLVSEYGAVKPYYGFAASPVIEEDLIILTVNNFGFALDKNTGNKVWGSNKPTLEKVRGHSTGTHYATPVMYDYNGKRYAAISNYEGLHSVEVKTRNVLWTYEWGEPYRGSYATDPIIFDNKVFITRYNEAGCLLLDIGGGKPKVLWKNQNMSSDTSSPVLIDGYVYGVDGGPEVHVASLRSLDVETGEIMWEDELRTEKEKRMVTASLIAADGKLIILEDDGTLHIAEATPSSYQEISSGDVLDGEQKKRQFWTHPVLYKGKIYCRNYVGDLVCIDVSK